MCVWYYYRSITTCVLFVCVCCGGKHLQQQQQQMAIIKTCGSGAGLHLWCYIHTTCNVMEIYIFESWRYCEICTIIDSDLIIQKWASPFFFILSGMFPLFHFISSLSSSNLFLLLLLSRWTYVFDVCVCIEWVLPPVTKENIH